MNRFLYQHRFSVAPMMEWTDRHCRYFHRQLTSNAVLYTEMVTADAVIHAEKDRLIGFSDVENPLVLQLGGSDPEKLKQAVLIAQDFGYQHFNLNVGCPSDRVQSGCFGASLMLYPKLVAECIKAMKAGLKGQGSVSVKCRIGVDDQDSESALDDIARYLIDVDVDFLTVHARKAWLKGLSPKENREIPPLDYARVYRLKQKYPDLPIYINGGINSPQDGLTHLCYVDGVMLGRSAYYEPRGLLDVDHLYFDSANAQMCIEDFQQLIQTMMIYSENVIAGGGKLSHVTRHMLGLMHGFRGAKKWRRILTEGAILKDAAPELLLQAFNAVEIPR